MDYKMVPKSVLDLLQLIPPNLGEQPKEMAPPPPDTSGIEMVPFPIAGTGSPRVLPPERATDFITPQGETTPLMGTGASLPTDPIPAPTSPMAPPAAPPAPGAPQGTDTSGRRMALALMEGLTRAGAEASNVPGLLELMAGKGRGPTDQTTADMLRRARELDMQREESANSPLVKMVNEAFGVDVKNAEEAKQVLAAEQAKSGLATEAFKRGEGPAAEKMQAQAGEQEKQKLTQELYKRRNEIQKLPSWAQLQTSIQKARQVLTSIRSGNPKAALIAGPQLAKASGEVGNLAQQEQTKYTDLPGLVGIADKLKTFFQGHPTEENIATIEDIAQEYLDTALAASKDMVGREVQGFQEAYPGVDEGMIRKQFETLIPSVGEKEETILMIDPSGEHADGMRIPPDELQMWLDAGWERG